MKYQPAAADNSDCCGRVYVNPNNPDVSLVIAIGMTNANYFFGMCAAHSAARVTHYGFDESSPPTAYGDGSGDSVWRSYGGINVTTSMPSEMHTEDEAVHMVFKFESIAPGASVQFDFAHVLSETAVTDAITSVESSALPISASYCLENGIYTTGNVDCTTGEIFLRGQYIEIGIHNVGSYGTYGVAPPDSNYAGQSLSIIADFDRNGWNKTAQWGFAGDYFIPGSPLEGI